MLGIFVGSRNMFRHLSKMLGIFVEFRKKVKNVGDFCWIEKYVLQFAENCWGFLLGLDIC